jgi:hypothetical protein
MENTTVGKLNQKISAPGSMKMPQGGQTDGIKKGSHARGGQLSKVQGVSSAPAGTNGASFTPVQSQRAGKAGKHLGQSLPDLSPVSTKKPNRKGGSNFYGDR